MQLNELQPILLSSIEILSNSVLDQNSRKLLTQSLSIDIPRFHEDCFKDNKIIAESPKEIPLDNVENAKTEMNLREKLLFDLCQLSILTFRLIDFYKNDLCEGSTSSASSDNHLKDIKTKIANSTIAKHSKLLEKTMQQSSYTDYTKRKECAIKYSKQMAFLLQEVKEISADETVFTTDAHRTHKDFTVLQAKANSPPVKKEVRSTPELSRLHDKNNSFGQFSSFIKKSAILFKSNSGSSGGENKEFVKVTIPRLIRFMSYGNLIESQRVTLSPKQEMRLELAALSAKIFKISQKGKMENQRAAFMTELDKIANQIEKFYEWSGHDPNKMDLDNQRFVASDKKLLEMDMAGIIGKITKMNAKRCNKQVTQFYKR